jgi:hypothetical protein
LWKMKRRKKPTRIGASAKAFTMEHSRRSSGQRRGGHSAGVWAYAKYAAILAAIAILFAPTGISQNKKKADQHIRSVQGLVTGPDGQPVEGAVVQLKNTKTLQVRSFITQQGGTYNFQELSTDVDYELRAESHGLSSGTKSLSAFDSRKQATLDLKLKK